MKSYTDLEQSKVLAEILPLESADVWYSYYGNSKYNPTITYKGQQWFLCQIRNSLHDDIPCWSLTALLEILPAECECMSLEHINYGNNHKKYFMSYIGGENTEDYDNPVDACYEMIIRLNKLNLL